MCGIAGIISRNRPVDQKLLEAMGNSIFHRGPDSGGVWISPDRSIGFAHRRLAVLDLSVAANQPMVSADSRYAIVFNGEIYNYSSLRDEQVAAGVKFFSNSDTEVVLNGLALYGTSYISKLRGMFAFAFVDTKMRQVIMARDRVGEKPLFWAKSESGISFASELKSILVNPDIKRKINPRALDSYLTYGYTVGTECMLAGVSKVSPGTWLKVDVDSGNTAASSYWSLPTAASAEHFTPVPELLPELERLLRSSVSEQMVADVPVGVLLSGGIDSSLITALASETYPGKIKTFTITVPSNPNFNEASYASQIAKRFNTEHIELEATGLTLELLPQIIRQFDEPICDSSVFPTLMVSKLVRNYCTVALGGDGGDELFGGYNSYQSAFNREKLRAILPSAFRRLVAGISENCLPIGTPKRNGLMALKGDATYGILRDGTFFNPQERRRLCPILQTLSSHEIAEASKMDFVEIERGCPGAAMAADFRTYLPDDILAKLDRASMLASLEIRAPFLDHRLIEFAFSKVSNPLRVNGKTKKILLKHLARKILPENHNIDRKQGFSIPLADWMDSEFVGTHILSSSCEVFARSELAHMCGRMMSAGNNSERIFSLAVLSGWFREYKVSV